MSGKGFCGGLLKYIAVCYKVLFYLKGGVSMKKRSLTLAVLLLLVLSVHVHGIYYIVRAMPSLSFSGTTASCAGRVAADNDSDAIKATLTLWDGSKVVDSWSSSGTGSLSLSGSCTVSKGKKYTLTLDATVNGVSISQRSTSGTC